MSAFSGDDDDDDEYRDWSDVSRICQRWEACVHDIRGRSRGMMLAM